MASTHLPQDTPLAPLATQEGAAVLRMAARGWRLFPIEAGGKRPLIADCPNQATSDVKQIRSWLRHWQNCNWAVATGAKSGIFVLDVDGEPGVAAIHALCSRHGFEWTETLAVGTARGSHLYFRWPEGGTIRNSTGRLASGLDVRAEGGYVIVPPSVHSSGHVYQWIGSGEVAPVAPAPNWLLECLEGPSGARNCGSPTLASETTTVIPDGQRNTALASLAGTMRRREMTRQAIEAALLAENASRCKPPLPEHEVRSIARSVCQYQAAAPETGAVDTALIVDSCTWPAPLRPEAFYGLPGEFCDLVGPESEADPAALLFSFLAAAGSIFGRGPHYSVGGDRHYGNLFAVIVAPTSKGRKGSSWGEVRRLGGLVDGVWLETRVQGGLASGEGLLWAVRDPIIECVAQKEGKKIIGREEQVIDTGVEDKRLCVVESELAQALQAASRDGNTLTALLRQAWDGTPLRVLAKSARASCLEPHISIVGHITAVELRRLLVSTQVGNGFANRFLFVCARRSKCLPFGGTVEPRSLADLAARIKAAVDFCRTVEQITFAPSSKVHWAEIYPALSEGKPGLFGSVIARGEAQAVRLAMLYALLDCSTEIRLEHLEAALAGWQYCADSARFIFGDELGDPTADETLDLLRRAPDGMTRTGIRDHFTRNKSSAEIGRALAVLQEAGLARSSRRQTNGRAAEVWCASVPVERYARNALNAESPTCRVSVV